MKSIIRRLILLLAIAALTACCACGLAAENGESGETGEPWIVDLDLSVMSSTFVYAQVYNMVYDPDAYLGKIIRMAGYYNYFNDEEHGIVYHACVVPDATACCAQGIEFVWAEDRIWPDEYPEIGTDIVVTGRLEMYEENGTYYLHLVDAELVWEQNPEPRP